MIDYETYARIKNYFENDGLKYSQIADALSLDIRTVAKWANEQRYRPRKSTPRKSKLDPFKDEIVRMIEKHPYTGPRYTSRLKKADLTAAQPLSKTMSEKSGRPRQSRT